jgi:type VI secretion system protein ImpF
VSSLKKSSQRVLRPSLLDRLIDDEPGKRVEARDRLAQSLNELKDSVRRDLEWLLNTRRPPIEPHASAKELWKSVYCYGLPDTTGMMISSVDDRGRMARLVAAAVSAFEPRLTNVVVEMDTTPASDRTVRFRIEALLRTEPAPSRVYFDTKLELISGEYEIQGEQRAR